MKTLALRRANHPTRKMIRKQQRTDKKQARKMHQPVPVKPQKTQKNSLKKEKKGKREIEEEKKDEKAEFEASQEQFELNPERFDYLDEEIRVLEKKLGLRKGEKSGKKAEVEKNWKKMRRYLELDGLGCDFYDKLEGKEEDEGEEMAVEVNPEDEEAEMREASELAAEDLEERDSEEVEEMQEDTPPPAPKSQPVVTDVTSLPKQFTSLLNRLSEANIDPVTRQLSDLYQHYSLSDCNTCLTSTLLSSSLKPAFVPICVMTSQTAAIAALGKTIGKEVIAYTLKAVFDLFKASSTEKDTKKHCVAWVSYLYLFGGVGNSMVTGLLRELGRELTEETIEFLIETMGIVGFKLRKSDPEALKSIITDLQSKAKPLLSLSSKRTQFLLEILLNVKNNKKKLSKDDHLLFLKNWLKTLKNSKESLLNASWEDLSTSRWRELVSISSISSKKAAKAAISAPNEALKSLAAATKMNTDARKSVFYAIMSAGDYQDGYIRVMNLGHVKGADREIMRVLLVCCGQEKTYNEYYSLLAWECIRNNKKMKYDFQYSLWDAVKSMEEFTPRKVANLAKFTAFLLAKQSADLAVLRVIQMENMGVGVGLFLRVVMEDLLLTAEVAALEAIFGKAAKREELNPFCEGLSLYLKEIMLHRPRAGFIVRANLGSDWGRSVESEGGSGERRAPDFAAI